MFSTVQYFRPDYGDLLELHTLTPVAHSYALLLETTDLIECLRGIKEATKHIRAINTVATDDIFNYAGTRQLTCLV